MPVLTSVRERLVLLESWIAGGSLFLLLVLALVQVVARNLFDSGIAEADTLTRYLVLYVTFFGAALAVDRDRHIKIDIACVLLQPTTLRRIYRPMRLIAAIVCGLFTDAAIRYWLDSWAYSPEHERWLVLVSIVIPVGFCLLTLHFILSALLGKDDDTCSLP